VTRTLIVPLSYIIVAFIFLGERPMGLHEGRMKCLMRICMSHNKPASTASCLHAHNVPLNAPGKFSSKNSVTHCGWKTNRQPPTRERIILLIEPVHTCCFFYLCLLIVIAANYCSCYMLGFLVC